MKALAALWLLATVLSSLLSTARSQGNRPYPQQGAGGGGYPRQGGGGGGYPPPGGGGGPDCRYVCFIDHCAARRCFYTCNRPRRCEDQGVLLNTPVGFDEGHEIPTDAQFFEGPVGAVDAPTEDPVETPDITTGPVETPITSPTT
ncbi:uncharacterized protein ISCGN_021581 [Ixodes scapularis]